MSKIVSRSATYVKIIELFHDLQRQAIDMPVYSTNVNDATFKRGASGKTAYRIRQEIVLTDNHLWTRCKPSEWHLIGRILHELYEYNALWLCSSEVKRSSTARSALKGLIVKNILLYTETAGIYLVNPVCIRRGDAFTILATMADMLKNSSKVTTDHLRHCKPVKDQLLLG